MKIMVLYIAHDSVCEFLQDGEIDQEVGSRGYCLCCREDSLAMMMVTTANHWVDGSSSSFQRLLWWQAIGNQRPPPNSVWFGVTPLKVGAKAASTGCWKIKDICFLACAVRFNNTWWDYGLTRPGGTCHAIGLSGCHLIVDVRHH